MEQPGSRRLLGLAAVMVIGLLAGLLPSGPAPTHLLFGDQHVFVPEVWSILVNIAVGNLPSIILILLSAAAGAYLGGRIYSRKMDRSQSAGEG